jgi:hypothetical protein
LMMTFLIVLPVNFQLPKMNTRKKKSVDSNTNKMTAENPFLKRYLHLAQVYSSGILFIIGSESTGNSSAAISNERMTP